MKTLLVAQQLARPAPGGIGTYIKGLVSGLNQVSVPPTLWCSAGHGQLGLDAPVRTARLSSALLSRAWDHGWCPAPEDFDVVHAASLQIPPSKAPLTAMVHDLAWRSHPDAFPARGRRWHEQALTRAVQNCARIIVPSTQTANDLMADEVPAQRIEVIPHGHDHLPSPDVAGGNQLLDAAGVEGPFLLAVGTLEPRKNLPRLVEAYSRIRDQLPEPYPLVLVGQLGWGKALAPADGVHIITTATDAQLVHIMQRATLMAYVPLVEGYGLPVVEAMSLQLPVVLSAVPAGGSSGYRVDPLNVAAISEGLLRVTTDDALRKDLAVDGLSHARRHTWAQSARAHLDVWQQL